MSDDLTPTENVPAAQPDEAGWKVYWSKRFWRSTLRDARAADVARILKALTDMMNDRQAEEDLAAAEQARKTEILGKIWDQVRDNGMTWEDLQAYGQGGKPRAKLTQSGRARRVIPPKYRSGENVWTGQGRTPRWLQALLDQGHTKEEFLIPAAAPEAPSAQG